MFDLFDREKYIAQLPDVSVLAVRKFRYCNIKLAVEVSRKEKRIHVIRQMNVFAKIVTFTRLITSLTYSLTAHHTHVAC